MLVAFGVSMLSRSNWKTSLCSVVARPLARLCKGFDLFRSLASDDSIRAWKMSASWSRDDYIPCESLLPAFYSSAYMTIVPDVPTIQKCISSAWPPERRFSTKKWKMKIALVVALSQQTEAYILKWCAFNVDILELCVSNQSLGTGPVHKSGYLLSRPLECERITCTWRNVGREHGVSLQTSQTSPRRLTIIETC